MKAMCPRCGRTALRTINLPDGSVCYVHRRAKFHPDKGEYEFHVATPCARTCASKLYRRDNCPECGKWELTQSMPTVRKAINELTAEDRRNLERAHSIATRSRDWNFTV